MTTTVPRVAERIDDLRVGMVVAYPRDTGGEWQVITVYNQAWADDWPQQVVILSDPPPEPVSVPSDLIDALAKAVSGVAPSRLIAHDARPILDAARAVVAAARNGSEG